MKRLLCTAAAIAMIFSGIAAAQPAGNKMAAQPAQPQTKPARPTHNRPQPGQPSIQPVKPGQPGSRPNRPGHRPPATIQPVRPPHHGRPPHGRPPAAKPLPVYRPGHHPAHIRPIHRPAFVYPRGWHYRHWRVGLFLPRIFLVRTYYFRDWVDLGLGPPPPGLVWVRFGPDLLLVNVHTGRIVDVIYGAFY